MDNVKVEHMIGGEVRKTKWGGAVMYLVGKDTGVTGKLVLHSDEVRRIAAEANRRDINWEG